MPAHWQEIEDRCLPCHWWQHIYEGRIAAMNLDDILALAAITVLAAWFALRFTALRPLSHRPDSPASGHERSPLSELPYTSFQANRKVDLHDRPI